LHFALCILHDAAGLAAANTLASSPRQISRAGLLDGAGKQKRQCPRQSRIESKIHGIPAPIAITARHLAKQAPI